MNKVLIAGLFTIPMFCTNVSADTTLGIGFGSMYNGLGINFGRIDGNSLTFVALGCIGGSYSSGSSRSGTSGTLTTSDSSYDTNCGGGLGYISTAMLPGDNHGLGLSIGYTYDTDDNSGGSEFHIMPGYHYFWNGIGQRGLNLGFGARVTRSEEGSADTGFIFNLGYQF